MDKPAEAPPGVLAVHGGEPVCRIKFGPRWVFDETDKAQLMKVLDRAATVWRSGDQLREFKRELARVFGLRHAMPTGSGTAALHAAFGALDFEPGDEVITSPATDVGSLIGLLAQNLVPVFADWLPGTFNTDPASIERCITERTRAILVVHLFGIPCEMDAILDIARRHGLRVVEDCAQAHLAEYQGRKLGTLGDIAGFSFGLKTLSTDQGGMVATSDHALAQQARGFLSKGSEPQGTDWLPYARLGSFSPMTDLQAAVGISQLAKLEDATQRRIMVAGVLDDTLASLRGLRSAPRRNGDRNVYYVYPYHLDAAAAGVSLEDFVAALRAEGVLDAFGPYLHGRALHRAPLFMQARTYGCSGYPLRDAQGLARVDYSVVRLPEIERTLPGLGFFHMRNSFTQAQAEAIAGAVLKVARHFAMAAPRVAMSVTPPAVTAAAALPVAPVMPAVPPVPPRPPAHAALRSPGASTQSSAAAFGHGFDFTHFGALPNGRRADAARNDAAMTALLAATAMSGARIFVPRGTYHFAQPIRLHGRRNLRFVGEGGNPVQPGTRWIYIGSDSAGLLDLATALDCGFEAIEFVAEGGCGDQVVQMRCDDTRDDGLSTSGIVFDTCSFRVKGTAAAGQAGVRLRDSAVISFRGCRFMGVEVGVELGVPIGTHAGTRSNGLANSVVFEACQLFADITGQRASNIRLTDCVFSVLPGDGRGAAVDFGRHADAEVRNVTLSNCFAIESRRAVGAFFRQGAAGQGLVFQGNRIAGYACAVALDGLGHAIVQANEFAQTAPGALDISIGALAREVFCMANNSARTTAAGNLAVRDERASG